MDEQSEAKQTQSAKTPTTPTTTDDESITTSTASDTFETWTFVNDKGKASAAANGAASSTATNSNTAQDTVQRIEILPKDDDNVGDDDEEEEEQENDPLPETDCATTTSATDEFSDEVSIISESDSGEVLTPHPLLRENLQKLNFKLTTSEDIDFVARLLQQQQHRDVEREQEQTTPPNTPTTTTSPITAIRQRKRRSPSADVGQKSLRTTSGSSVTGQTAKAPSEACKLLYLSSLTKRVYAVFFYCIIAFMILAFFGKLRYPEWSPLSGGSSSHSVSELESKIADMELNNNLMRAEIDILNKQINYLNNQRQNQRMERERRPHMEQQQQQHDRKSNNEWSQMSVDFEELKANYFQPLELNPELDVEPEAAEDVDNAENVQETEQAQSKSSQMPPIPAEDNKNQELPAKSPPRKPDQIRMRYRDENNQVRYAPYDPSAPYAIRKKRQDSDEDEKSHEQRHNKQHSKARYNSKERRDYDDNDDNSKERFNKHKKHSKQNGNNNSKERYNRNENDGNNNAKERSNNNSKERLNNKSKERLNNNSKERFNRNENGDNSKERKQQKRRKNNSGEDQHSGEWHERLMQQRENMRHIHQQREHGEKNWYLNRQDAREQWRSEEFNRR